MSYTLKFLPHCYWCYYSYFSTMFPLPSNADGSKPDSKPLKHRKSFHDFHLDHRNNSTFPSGPADDWLKLFWQTVQLFCAFVPFTSLNCFWFLLFLVVFSVVPSVLDLSLSQCILPSPLIHLSSCPNVQATSQHCSFLFLVVFCVCI